MPNLLEGKTALILGIANKWSLAYAIAQAFWREGATLALTYLGDRQKIAIEEMSAGMPVAGLWPCDVTKEEDLQRSVRVAGRAGPSAGRGSAQPGVRQPRRPVAPVRRDRPRRVPAGAGGQRLFAGGGGPRHGSRHDRRRRDDDPDLPGIDARGAQLQRDGRGQGVAGGLGALPGERSGPAAHPRKRHLGRAGEDRLGARASKTSPPFWTTWRRARRCAATPIPPKWPIPPSSWPAIWAAASPPTPSSSTPAFRSWVYS